MEYQKWLKQISKEIWDNDLEKSILKHLKSNEYKEADLKTIHKYIVDLHFAYMHQNYAILLETFKDTNWLEILKSQFKIFETEILIKTIDKDLKTKGFNSQWLKWIEKVKEFKNTNDYIIIDVDKSTKEEIIIPISNIIDLLIHFLAIKVEFMNDLFFSQFETVEKEDIETETIE